jgi:hypothetical protein
MVNGSSCKTGVLQEPLMTLQQFGIYVFYSPYRDFPVNGLVKGILFCAIKAVTSEELRVQLVIKCNLKATDLYTARYGTDQGLMQPCKPYEKRVWQYEM